jgi:hypothetical protein
MTFIVINSTPKIKVEVVTEPALSNTMFVRIYVANSAGDFGLTANDGINPWVTWGSNWDQLEEMLRYSGTAATGNTSVWLQGATKEQAMNAVIKWIREKFLPALVACLNKLLGKTPAPPVDPSVPYKKPEELLLDALKKTTFTINADGSVSANI